MLLGDTIVARASAPGIGRRAILRLSGPQTWSALHEIGVDAATKRAARRAVATVPMTGTSSSSPVSGSPRHLSVGRPRGRTDGCSAQECGPTARLPVLLLTFEPGHSYTGEASAEVLLPNCHPLVESILDRLCAIDGVRRADPGEFTARAFLSGRLSLAQAEGVAAKIAAESARQLEAADRLLTGVSGDDYRSWADDIARLLALVEAGIDFVDQEDVVPIAAGTLGRELAELRAGMNPLLGTSRASEWCAERPLAVLVGPPNAGKSTLFNALLGRRRTVTAAIAGTTRDAIIEPLDLSGVGAQTIDLADLPGLEANAASALDHAARQSALDTISRADVVIACDPAARFDHPPTGATVIRVRTKSDEHLAAPGAAVAVCALDGWHLPSLRRALAEQCFSVRRHDDALLIPRHRQIVASALAELTAACELAAEQPRDTLENAEFIAARLRSALDLLGELAGHITRDDVIGRIFATFCVGK